jgi:hypothetical protein
VFEQVLPENSKAVLAALARNELIQKAQLGGGTGLALHLGHRISGDLDFFTAEDFDENRVLPLFRAMPDFHLEKTAWKTVLGRIGETRFGLFYYDYPLLFPPARWETISVLDPRDIAAMKIAAIASRGAKRDFIDLYFFCREIAPLQEALRLYDAKFRNLTDAGMHIVKSLTYFEDADSEEMPHLLKPADWNEIKNYFREKAIDAWNSWTDAPS